MSINAGTAFVDIVPNMKGFSAKVAAGAEASIKSSGVERAVNRALVPAVAGLAAVGVAAKVGFKELKESQLVAAQTASVIKSTGGAANVTAQDVDKLATSLLNKSGVDDEVIKQGQNMLLTFTNIRNEVGKGNDIFNQATEIGLDMSVALGQDATRSALQLGKALNDPVKGVTALQRVGVSFTAAQKEQIKTLVETGDTLGAQKLILKELRTEFGGSAEAAGNTFAGKMNIARETAKNFLATLVEGALPALTAMADILGKVAKFLGEHKTATQIALGAVLAFSTAIIGLKVAMMVGRGATLLYTAALNVGRAAMVVWTTVQKAATAAQWLWNAAMAANPIGLVVVAIGAVIAAGVLLVKNWKAVSEFFGELWANLKVGAEAIVEFFTTTFIDAFKSILDWLKSNWKTIVTIISGPFAPLVALATNAFGLRSKLIQAFTAIKNFIKDRITDIVGFFTALPGRLLGAITRTASTIRDNLQNAMKAVKTFIKDRIDDVVRFFTNLPGRVEGVVKSLGTRFVNWLVDGFKGFGRSLWEIIKAGLNYVISRWNQLKIPSIGVHIGLPDPIPDINFSTPEINFPDVPLLARGGIVNSPMLAGLGERGSEAVLPLDSAHGRTALADALREAVAGGGLGVVVNQYFTRQPDDPIVWLRKSQFAAKTVYGGGA